jgi:hypothetical protein
MHRVTVATRWTLPGHCRHRPPTTLTSMHRHRRDRQLLVPGKQMGPAIRTVRRHFPGLPLVAPGPLTTSDSIRSARKTTLEIYLTHSTPAAAPSEWMSQPIQTAINGDGRTGIRQNFRPSWRVLVSRRPAADVVGRGHFLRSPWRISASGKSDSARRRSSTV